MVEYILLVQKANTHIGASRFMRVFSLMIEDLLVLIAFVETSRDGGALNFREREIVLEYILEKERNVLTMWKRKGLSLSSKLSRAWLYKVNVKIPWKACRGSGVSAQVRRRYVLYIYTYIVILTLLSRYVYLCVCVYIYQWWILGKAG